MKYRLTKTWWIYNKYIVPGYVIYFEIIVYKYDNVKSKIQLCTSQNNTLEYRFGIHQIWKLFSSTHLKYMAYTSVMAQCFAIICTNVENVYFFIAPSYIIPYEVMRNIDYTASIT